jgi:hypothetical protein
MAKTPKPIGRAVVDENGNRAWKWANQDNMDTARVRALGEDLSLETPTQGVPALDPYNRGAPAAGPEAKPAKPEKRRTLDDMRKLSEQIKRTKIWTRGD